MSFEQGLSGLNSSSKNLDVIGNNIANSTTVGFKSGSTQFADVYATSIFGGSDLQSGIGTKVTDIAQQFTQGNTTVTNNPLDVAINGDGFFRLSNNGAITYSRNGQFHLDANGYLVNSTGQNVMGYTALTTNSSGTVTSANTLGNIQIDLNNLAPNPTSTLSMVVNLNANASVIDRTGAITGTAVPFNAADSSTYTYSTTATVYDSQGGSHALTYYFSKTASNTWDVNATMDGNSAITVGISPNTLSFNAAGALTSSPLFTATTTGLAAAGVSELSVAMNLTGTSQVAGSSGVNSISQNGYAQGQIVGVSIDSNGIISGRYSNNLTRPLQQILLASFRNPNGLIPMGNNQWEAGQAAGSEVLNSPGAGLAGSVQSGATEDSNVDLTNELVNMIVAQRQYQANAQTIKAQDTIMQTLVNLG
jgi:flagellar hook protein FlgE